MIDVILLVYGAIALYTYWLDASYLHSMGYSYPWSVLVGIIDGLIWPVRWGWDLVVWLLNKRGGHK